MRGVHMGAGLTIAITEGSSPHARGPLSRCFFNGQTVGIIPACAGSTCWGNTPPPMSKDHPRMRGVHYSVPISFVLISGSSPHARGPHLFGTATLQRSGIIPACAGSTLCDSYACQPNRDHPRMRGVHQRVTRGIHLVEGSSPHARGPRASRRLSFHQCGIIPACAGSTR